MKSTTRSLMKPLSTVGANVHNLTETHRLLHGWERRVVKRCWVKRTVRLYQGILPRLGQEHGTLDSTVGGIQPDIGQGDSGYLNLRVDMSKP